MMRDLSVCIVEEAAVYLSVPMRRFMSAMRLLSRMGQAVSPFLFLRRILRSAGNSDAIPREYRIKSQGKGRALRGYFPKEMPNSHTNATERR